MSRPPRAGSQGGSRRGEKIEAPQARERLIPAARAQQIPAARAQQIKECLLAAGIRPLPATAIEQFQAYLELLLRWNARLNLTSDRTPEELIHRHFVPCAFAAQQLPQGISSLLDFGSGAGFPGIPIAICRPGLRVTLAESRGKKASFLQEAVRVVEIAGASVFPGRVENLPSRSRFDAVTLRAVDKMAEAISAARPRAEHVLALLTTDADAGEYRKLAPEFLWDEPIRLPQSATGILLLGRRGDSSNSGLARSAH